MEKSNQIILVNPWIHDFSSYDLWLKPLGLLYIASALERAGFRVHLIDCLDYRKVPRAYGCGKFYSEEIAKPCHFKTIPRKYKRYGMPPDVFSKLLIEANNALADSPPLFIGLTSMMTYWHHGVAETIRYIKQCFSDTPVILGGVYATLCHEHAIKNSGADHVIKGPGEDAILALAHSLNPNPSAKNKSIQKNTTYPSYHLYKPNQTENSAAILTSRGCLFRCSYCASASLTSGFSQRPPDEVIGEIAYYQTELAITDIAFYDDALLANPKKHIHPILDRIIKSKLNQRLRFHAPNGLHARYIDQTLAHKLFRANFKTIRLGFESVNRTRDFDYKVHKEQLKQAMHNLKSAGFTAEQIGVYVLMGLPGQDFAEVACTMKFVHQCGAPIRISQYSPVPGSHDFLKLLPEYPQLKEDPLLHNKSAYYCHNQGRHFSEFENIKLKSQNLNASLLKTTISL